MILPHLGRPSPDLWSDAILAGAVTHIDPSSIGACVAFVGLLWDLLTLDGCPRPEWYSGAFLLETVPCVLYILARHAQDPEEAVVRAVNDTRDNDTVAAIVGAAAGALHGRRARPERWQRNLLGRTREDDDGRVFDLIEMARSRFGRERA